MNQSKKLKIQHLLRQEVAAKAIASSYPFAVFAITLFFYHFNIEYFKNVVKVFSVVIVLLNISRHYYARKMLENTAQESYWKLLKIIILLNGVCWGVIFAFSATEMRFSGNHFAVQLLIVSSFLAGSLPTLSYDKQLFIPFQLNLIAPIIILSLWFGITENRDYLLISTILFYGLLYQFKQFKEFHKSSLERLSQQVDLEESNEALKISQHALIDQTVKLIHTSRIAALGEMSGGLSHEMNNSLMVILGSTQQIERKLKKEVSNPESFVGSLNYIRNASHKIKEVVEGLRFFSQEMDSGPMEEVELNQILDKTLSLCEELIASHNIKLEVKHALNFVTNCRIVQISQILFTLIRNAFDALSTVDDINEKWIKIEIVEKEGHLYLSVGNGGPKISDDVAGKLFQPFFTTKDIGKGSGLSLSIARGIALNHSGDIYLDNSASYTSFILKLPCKTR